MKSTTQYDMLILQKEMERFEKIKKDQMNLIAIQAEIIERLNRPTFREFVLSFTNKEYKEKFGS